MMEHRKQITTSLNLMTNNYDDLQGNKTMTIKHNSLWKQIQDYRQARLYKIHNDTWQADNDIYDK